MANETEGLEVEKASIEEGGVKFTFRNSSPERVYDVVKLYTGDKYKGFEYVDIPGGEEDSVLFDISEGEIRESDRVLFTTDSKEEGVIEESIFGDLLMVQGLESDDTEEQRAREEEVREPGIEADEQEVEDVERTDFAGGSGEEEIEIETEEEEESGRGVEELGLGQEEDEEVLEEDITGGGIEEETTGFEEERPQNQEIPEMRSVQEEGSSWGSISSTLSSFFSGGGKKKREGHKEETQEEEPGFEEGKQAVGEEGLEGAEIKEEEEDGRSSSEPLPSEMVDRVSTGIINLDGKMQGGLVKDTMNLVTGKTGTGKTAFSACFLKQGVDEDENGVYVTTEERKEDIHEDIRSMFGWDFAEYEEEGKMKVMSIKPVFPSKEIDNLNRLVRSYITDLLNEVKTAIEEIDADRVVIDSVSIIEMFIRDEYMARVALSKLLNSLREEEVTAVFTGGIPETSEGLSGGGIIEYLVDTVILLEFVPVAEEHTRTLTIRKMRRTDHEVEIFPLEITPHGMKIEEVEKTAI